MVKTAPWKAPRTAALVASFLVACGDTATDPDPNDPAAVSVVETEVVWGQDQVRFPGTMLVMALWVAAIDASGELVEQAGIRVSWGEPSSGHLEGADPVTDARGLASAQWRLGETLGDHGVEVRIAESPTVSINARIVEPGPILFESDRAAFAPPTRNLAEPQGPIGGLFTMNADGSDVAPVRLGSPRTSARSPDGSRVVFWQNFRDGPSPMLLSLDDLEERSLWGGIQEVFAGAYGFAWAPDGSTLAYGTEFAANGGQVLMGADDCWEGSIWTVASDGSDRMRVTYGERCWLAGWPDWSPDGSQLAFQADGTVWTMALDGSEPAPVPGNLSAGQPKWLPDSRRVVVGDVSDAEVLRIVDTETGSVEEIWQAPPFSRYLRPGGVSPDGRYAVIELGLMEHSDIFRIDLETGDAVNLTNRPDAWDQLPSWWSGDGQGGS